LNHALELTRAERDDAWKANAAQEGRIAALRQSSSELQAHVERLQSARDDLALKVDALLDSVEKFQAERLGGFLSRRYRRGRNPDKS